MNIKVKWIRAKSLFKIMVVGVGGTLAIIFLILGIFTLFGVGETRISDREVEGVTGFLSVIAVYPIFWIGFTGLGWILLMPGLYLWYLFGGALRIELVEAENTTKVDRESGLK